MVVLRLVRSGSYGAQREETTDVSPFAHAMAKVLLIMCPPNANPAHWAVLGATIWSRISNGVTVTFGIASLYEMEATPTVLLE